MLQVDERFHKVNLDNLKKEFEVSINLGFPLKTLIEMAIKEIEMHREFHQNWNQYRDFMKEST